MSIQVLRDNLAHARQQKYEFAIGLQADEIKAALDEVAGLEAQLAEANDKRKTLCSLLKDTVAQRDEAEADAGRLREALDNALAAWAADMDGADRIGAIFQNIYQEGLAAIADAEQPAESEEAK